jgi:small redox-active disulfide protein 2
MVIQILGNCCNHCTKLYTNTIEAVKELNLEVEVEQEGDIIKILQHKVMRTPALLIDDKIISEGETLSVKKIKEILLNEKSK